MSGKGSNQRTASVSRQLYERNWERAFEPTATIKRVFAPQFKRYLDRREDAYKLLRR